MDKLIKPKMPDIQGKMFKLIGAEFLKKNNLKLGDHILWDFRFQTLRGKYKSREMSRYSAYEESEGVLREDENGFLYVESIKKYKFYTYVNNELSGRHKKSWYKSEERHSKHYFGTGFIFVEKK